MHSYNIMNMSYCKSTHLRQLINLSPTNIVISLFFLNKFCVYDLRIKEMITSFHDSLRYNVFCNMMNN